MGTNTALLSSVKNRPLLYINQFVRTSFNGYVPIRCKTSCPPPSKTSKALTLETMNPHIIVMQYAVRGPLMIRAGELEKELEKVFFDYNVIM